MHSATAGDPETLPWGYKSLLFLPAWFQRGDEEQGPNFCHWLIGPESPRPLLHACPKFWSAQVWLNMQNASSDCGCILPVFWLPLVGSKSIILWKSKGLDRLTQGLCLVHDHGMSRPCPTGDGACAHGSRRVSLEAARQTKQHTSAESDRS